MHTQELSPSRRRRSTPRWATSIAVIGALAFAPAVLVAAPAFAATVDSPAEGSTDNPALVFFDGTGDAGNTITITYPGTAGPAVAGQDLVDGDGNFSIISEFSALAPGQTTVTATVTEDEPDGTDVGTPVVRTFSFATAPVEEFPFAVISPAQGETVTTTTPTFTGTGRAGDTVTITYSNAVAGTSVAGTGVVALDGTFSIPTDFGDLTPGAVEVRTISEPTGPGGTPSDSANVFTNFLFSEAPVPPFVPNPQAIDIVPDAVTVAESTSTGVEITATGFGQREELTITVAGPDGDAAVVESDTGFFADDTGSYADSLVLFGTVVTGQYTVTITGAGGLVLTDTFTVVPNPGTAGTPGGGQLAATGPDDAGSLALLALAVLLTLSGAALVVRRKVTEVTAS